MSLKILVIEDNPIIRQGTVDWLTSQGHEVMGVPCKLEMDKVCGQNDFHPDLYIVDLMLPGCSGEKIAQTLRRREPHAKVLITTGVPDRELNGLSYHVLRKPYDYTDESLGRAMREAMETTDMVRT